MKGFSLIEILLVVAMLALLAILTTPYTVKFYSQFQLDSERSTMLSLLRQARTMSLSSENDKAHGLNISTTTFTVYEGSTYATRDQSKDQTFPRISSITISGPSEVVFRRLTGLSTTSTWTLSNYAKSGNVYVNTEGTIDWK